MKAGKDKALTPNVLDSLTIKANLSDRLKQAGIRECQPKCETKTGNLHQNGKIQPKRGLVEKSKEGNKKLQSLGNECYLPDFKVCYQTSSKNCGSFPKALRRKIKGSAKKTIFTSLNFIKDCQKYKKKVVNPEKQLEFNREGKGESVFSNHKQNLYTMKEPRNLHASKTYNQIPVWDNIKKKKEPLTLDISENKEAKNTCERTDPLFFDQNTEELDVTDEKKSQLNTKVSKTSSYVKSFCDKFPSSDVAKIDRKYLQSLLSITKTKDKMYTNDCESKSTEETTREKQGQKKRKKKSNEVCLENKVRIKKSEDRGGAAEETTQIPFCKKSVLAKILRDSTKSEAQIIVHKNKLHDQRSSEMKSEKNVANIKPTVNDTRKNRKTRNRLLKNKNGELSDSIFSSEVSKITDIKELWRREDRKESDDSLTSDSSCTVSKNDTNPEQKNSELKSYKLLKKFVEDEVKKMSNESRKENCLKEIENKEYNFKTDEFESVNLKESEKVENFCDKLNTSMAKNPNDKTDTIKNEMYPLKKKLVHKHYSIYEGEKIPMQLNAQAENKLKDPKEGKKLIQEKERGSEKSPSQIINNWSILNRLEQAFLVLGTPNFQGKNLKNSKLPVKSQELNNKENFRIYSGKKNQHNVEKISIYSGKKDQHCIEKIDKKPPKSKETETKKSNSDVSSKSNVTYKTSTESFMSKKSEADGQQNLTKDNQQKNTIKKESKNGNYRNNIPVKIPEHRRIVIEQEKKKILNQTTQENVKKKSNVTSTAKPNIPVYNPRQLGRKTELRPTSKNNAEAKKDESCKKKLSKVLVQNKNSSQSLQKKTKLEIIQNRNPRIVQPRKSKSCNKIDDNFKRDNMKISFSQTKNKEQEKNFFFQENMKYKPHSGDKNMKNEAHTKIKCLIPKMLTKPSFKTKLPLYYENWKFSEVKGFLEVPRKSCDKIPEGTTIQEEPCENKQETEKQIQDQKKPNNQSERLIKERTILSISEKQQKSQKSLTKLLSSEGKKASDIYPSSKISNSASCDPEKSQNDFHGFLESPIESKQKTSSCATSKTNNYNDSLTDSSSTSNKPKNTNDRQERRLPEFSKKLSSSSGFTSNNSISTRQTSEPVLDEISELNLPKSKKRMLWEQDARHYNALVKEILSHYNRINGFLTQSNCLESFTRESAEQLSVKDSTDADSMSKKPLNMNLHEYRKRVLSEYKALPIFEYKKLLQEKKEENLLTKEANKRNLMVVKDVTTEMDLDVKDFQPKIQRVLDSQLYVDLENLIKRKHPKVKFKEKKSSLQEIILKENENADNEKFLRASSTTKTLSPFLSSSVCVEGFDKPKSIKSIQEYLTDTVTSTSWEETESEF